MSTATEVAQIVMRFEELDRRPVPRWQCPNCYHSWIPAAEWDHGNPKPKRQPVCYHCSPQGTPNVWVEERRG